MDKDKDKDMDMDMDIDMDMDMDFNTNDIELFVNTIWCHDFESNNGKDSFIKTS